MQKYFYFLSYYVCYYKLSYHIRQVVLFPSENINFQNDTDSQSSGLHSAYWTRHSSTTEMTDCRVSHSVSLPSRATLFLHKLSDHCIQSLRSFPKQLSWA